VGRRRLAGCPVRRTARLLSISSLRGDSDSRREGQRGSTQEICITLLGWRGERRHMINDSPCALSHESQNLLSSLAKVFDGRGGFSGNVFSDFYGGLNDNG
jgi:hypothetical protein